MKKTIIYLSCYFLMCSTSFAYTISDAYWGANPLVGSAYTNFNAVSGEIGAIASTYMDEWAPSLEEGIELENLSSAMITVGGKIAISEGEVIYINFLHEGTNTFETWGAEGYAYSSFNFNIGPVDIVSNLYKGDSIPLSFLYPLSDSEFFYQVTGSGPNYLSSDPEDAVHQAWFAVTFNQGIYDFSYTLQAEAFISGGISAEMPYPEGYAQSDFFNTANALFVQSAPAGIDVATINAQIGPPVPEPATMLLFGLGLLGIMGVSRRKK